MNDYLEERLAELNRQHLSDHSPWLLVQPSGIFPLVGPVFRPGKSACWSCLAERMRRNREVKAFLDRTQPNCVAVSPLAHDTFGQSGIRLAAIEIAKAIATDFRTEINDHIKSLDLLGSTAGKHYVAARPQCATCGRKELRDPGRAPTPIQLETGRKLVMTSGGYRSVGPTATVARFRKLGLVGCRSAGKLWSYAGSSEIRHPAVRPPWPGDKIALGNTSQLQNRRQSRSWQPFCVNVIRRAASTTSTQSRWTNFRAFSMALRVPCLE